MYRNAISYIYIAYNIAGKAFGNVLMSNFYALDFHVQGGGCSKFRLGFRGGAPNSDGGLGGAPNSDGSKSQKTPPLPTGYQCTFPKAFQNIIRLSHIAHSVCRQQVRQKDKHTKSLSGLPICVYLKNLTPLIQSMHPYNIGIWQHQTVHIPIGELRSYIFYYNIIQ